VQPIQQAQHGIVERGQDMGGMLGPTLASIFA
jgi:hypothetical protein